MTLKTPLTVTLVAVLLLAAAGLARECYRWRQVRHYNQAIATADYARAARFGGEAGHFARAYGLQQAGKFQEARVVYSTLEHSRDARLRAAVLYNLGNTYLEQAATVDMHKDADRALPLIELAKTSYRELLRIDAQHWDGRYNLERALQLSPDVGEQKIMNVEGRRSPVRTINSVDPEGALP